MVGSGQWRAAVARPWLGVVVGGGGWSWGPPQEQDLHPHDTHITGMCVQLRVSLELGRGG